jgi:cytochrome c oxidase assembly protein subunit 11
MTQPKQKQRSTRDHFVGLSLAGLVAVMVGLSFAAVPLYRLYCQATGYGGVPQRAAQAPGEVLDRTITIRFDGNVAPGLPWSFAPVQQTMDVKIGETALAFFKATNTAATPITGRAAFNVAPDLAGRYFTKIQCFCFTEQTLAAGASVEMPVTFYVDPKIVEDEDTNNMSEITLSYTFYPTRPQGPVAVGAPGDRSGS